ncbi:MAG TPA: hypothetical protein VD993_17855 [Chitinophagaceae bacterium]|nr:hypothetical protein [Chitinophagaceae bacterium]
METTLLELKQISDVQEACTKFGKLLGLDGPVPQDVLYAAIEDEDYARNLLLCRRNSVMLTNLLMQPAGVTATATAANGNYSNLQLIGKAAKALLDWSKTGFSTVDERTYERRLAACHRCDQLEAPPDKLLYKISLGKKEDKRTCKSCGCVVSRKARLTSDSCPLEDPANPGFNRWGEAR